jgi:ABC-type oligopeptide transport system substrate-binding subunit
VAPGEEMPLRLQMPKVDLIIDPHAMEDAYSMTIVHQVHRGLFRYTPSGDVIPDLVESWKVSDSGLQYLFKLKKSEFSDGKLIKSINVLHSFARLLAKGASMGADIEYINGAKEFRSTKDLSKLGISVIDDQTVQFELSFPAQLLLKHLATVDCAVLQIEDFKNMNALTKNTGVSGPYRITRHDKDHLLLEKWRIDPLDSVKPPHKLDFRLSDIRSVEMAENDQIDVLDTDILSRQEKDKLHLRGWHNVVTDIVSERFAILNPSKVSENTRKYLYSMINSDELARDIGKFSIKPAFGLIPSGVPGAIETPKQVAELKVKNKLAPVGSIKIQYAIDNSPDRFPIEKWLKEKWETKNFQVTLEPMSSRELLSMMFKSEGEVLLGAKGLDYFDGYSVLTYFRSTYESNYFFVKSKEVDTMLDKAVKIQNADERAKFYKEIQTEILKEYTIIPLLFGRDSAGLWHPRVRFVPSHPGGLHTLAFETIELK